MYPRFVLMDPEGAEPTGGGGLPAAPSTETNFADVAMEFTAPESDEGEGELGGSGTPAPEPVVEVPPTLTSAPVVATPAPQPGLPQVRVPQPVTPAAAQPAPTAAPQPAVATPPATPAVPAVPPTPAQAAPTVAQPAAQPQTVTQAQPVDQRAEYFKQRNDAITRLAEQYKLSDDDETALLTEPGKVLPKLKAEVMVDAMEGVFSRVIQMLPALMQMHQQQTAKANEYEQAFFSQYGELNKPEYRDTVIRVAQQVTQMYPQASLQERMQAIAMNAAMLLKIPMERLQSVVAPTVAAQPAVAPAAPAPTPAAPARPFVPAAPGASAPAVVPGRTPNIFEQLATFRDIEDA